MKRTTKRDLQAQETKAKIFETAKKLFSEYEVDEVTIPDIARAAGIAVGAPYTYFPTKDYLIACIIDELAVQLEEDFKTFFESLDKCKTADRLIVEVCGFVNEFMTRAVGHKKFSAFYRTLLTAKIADKPSAIIYLIVRHIAEIYAAGVQNGELIPAEPLKVALKIKTILCGLEVEFCINNNENFVEYTKELISEFIEHYKK
jgi:Transcriptional regulator